MKYERKHGHATPGSPSPEYRVWVKIKIRCYNENATHYDRYGGRGISMSDEWRRDFMAFYTDMGPRPSLKHSIDRINNDGDYCKENCRWATQAEQCRNKGNNRILIVDGSAMSMAEAAERCGLDQRMLAKRLKRGWDQESALSLPPGSDLVKQRRIVVFGETLTLAEASAKYGVRHDQLRDRLRHGWAPERAATEPVKHKRGSRHAT